MAIGYIDNVTLLKAGKTFAKVNRGLADMIVEMEALMAGQQNTALSSRWTRSEW